MQATKTETPVFESGKIVVSTDDLKVLDINLQSKHVDVNVENKAFIKRVIKMRSEISEINSEIEQPEENQKKKPPSALATLKTIAEALSSRGITVTLSYKGSTVVTIGSDAHPRLLQLITKTKAVSINSFYRLIGLII